MTLGTEALEFTVYSDVKGAWTFKVTIEDKNYWELPDNYTPPD